MLTERFPGYPVMTEGGAISLRQIVAALATLVAGIALATSGAAGGGFSVAFLVMAPALAVAGLIRSTDPLARGVLMLAAPVAVNVLVAEAMLATGTWSIPGGTATVGVLSAVLWLIPHNRGHRNRDIHGDQPS